jgi:hypothetical protein
MVAGVNRAVGIVIAAVAGAVRAGASGINIMALYIHLHPAVAAAGAGLALPFVIFFAHALIVRIFIPRIKWHLLKPPLP